MGGLGLLQTSDITEVAHSASVIDSFHLISALLTLSHDRHLEEVSRSAISLQSSRHPQLSSSLTANALFERCSSPVPGERLQSAITTELMLSKSDRLSLSATASDRARLLSVRTSSSSVFSSLPHPHRGTYMSSSAWKVALALRLGIAQFPGSTRCAVCSRRSADVAPVLDPSGQHALTCKYEDGMTRRHHVLRNVLARFCKEVGIAALFEHTLPVQEPNSSIHWESHLFPMDIYIPAAYRLPSTDIAVEVTVAFTSARHHISPSTVTAGAAATFAEREKHRHHGDYCYQHDILLSLVGIDIHGPLGNEGQRFFRLLASLAERGQR